MTTLPEIVDDLILERVRQLLEVPANSPLKESDLKKLALNTKRLSDYFTKKVEERPEFYLKDDRLMAAYLAYFLPSNLLKVNKALSELMLHPAVDQFTDCGGKLSVLDVGCGPGTATLGLINFLAQLEQREGPLSLNLMAADNTQQCLDEASLMPRRLWNAYSEKLPENRLADLTVRTVKLDMSKINEGLCGERFDLIILANSIGEILADNSRVDMGCDLVETLMEDHLEARGGMLIIEPALRDSSRKLLMIRDELLARGRSSVYSPCIIQDKCGALDNPKDWCHEGYGWAMTSLIKEMDKRTGFNKSQLKYSYLVLRKDGMTLQDILPADGGENFRVVSDLLIMKGERKVFLCGQRGRIQLGRLDRDLSDANRQFDEIRRGDIVEVKGIYQKGEVLRIDKEGSVRVISSL